MRILTTSTELTIGSGTVPDVSEILPRLWIGRALRSQEERLRLKTELGISALISLETDRDMEAAGLHWNDIRVHYRVLGIEATRIEIAGTWPAAVIERMGRAMRLVKHRIQNGHIVYLHCTAGVNRSPTVALMYLNLKAGFPLEEALATIQMRRPQAKPYEDVLVVLQALAARRE